MKERFTRYMKIEKYIKMQKTKKHLKTFFFQFFASEPSNSLMKQSATRSGLYQSGSYTTLSDISDYAQNLFDVGFDELKTPDSQSKSVSLENQIFLHAWCKMIKHIIKYANKIQSASLRTVLPSS